MQEMIEKSLSKAVQKDTLHTISFAEKCLEDGDSVLDIGCGEAHVLSQLAKRNRLTSAVGVDIVDIRTAPLDRFELYDGIKLPFEDNSFDLVMLNFVLHHVPNARKPLLLNEAHRVTKRNLVVMEDTPRSAFDRFFNKRHGEEYRSKIDSSASYGFYSKDEWEKVFAELGYSLGSSFALGRFCRNWKYPIARSAFIIGK
jgi:ubiquinone/menaquinone biosynthesis C-methylase UbiE